jgi:two-component system chemotaxis response regulator CheB
VLPKPAHGHSAELGIWGRAFADAAAAMASAPPPSAKPGPSSGRGLDLFALVSSTGGPSVLAEVLGGFKGARPPLPVLVVQHVAEGFSGGLCRWLEGATGLGVACASEGERPREGRVYLAPEGRDLELGPDGLLRTPKLEQRFGPSGDRLLRSLAASRGPRAGAAVLTGMGRDGAEGLCSLARAGGLTMVQEESSCAVNGMPAAALSLWRSHAVLCLQGIQAVIREASRQAPVHQHA